MLRMLLGGVIDEDIDMSELSHNLFNSASADLLAAYISRDILAGPPLVLHKPARLFGVAVLAEIEDRDVRTLAGERNRNRAPDPAVPSRYNGDLVQQLSASAMGRVA